MDHQLEDEHFVAIPKSITSINNKCRSIYSRGGKIDYLLNFSQRKILSNPAASCCCAFQSHLLLRPGSNFPASLVWMGLCIGEAKYLIFGGFIKLLQISRNWFLHRIIERLWVWMGPEKPNISYLADLGNY